MLHLHCAPDGSTTAVTVWSPVLGLHDGARQNGAKIFFEYTQQNELSWHPILAGWVALMGWWLVPVVTLSLACSGSSCQAVCWGCLWLILALLHSYLAAATKHLHATRAELFHCATIEGPSHHHIVLSDFRDHSSSFTALLLPSAPPPVHSATLTRSRPDCGGSSFELA